MLTLGYNTAIFNGLLRLARIPNVINMDGLEWKRKKWRWFEKAWLWLNERCASLFGSHLIADHPGIERHLLSFAPAEKVSMIPYGADRIQATSDVVLSRFGLRQDEYALLVARPEPENSILEIVTAFSRSRRPGKLVVLGAFDAKKDYHAKVLKAANEDVLFLGAIYDSGVVSALRKSSLVYVHGHRVGGTNPSLVEALGCGSGVLAHDNEFNRWVAGPSAMYFDSVESCEEGFDRVFEKERLNEMRLGSESRFRADFQWPQVLLAYRQLLEAVSAKL